MIPKFFTVYTIVRTNKRSYLLIKHYRKFFLLIMFVPQLLQDNDKQIEFNEHCCILYGFSEIDRKRQDNKNSTGNYEKSQNMLKNCVSHLTYVPLSQKGHSMNIEYSKTVLFGNIILKSPQNNRFILKKQIQSNTSLYRM